MDFNETKFFRLACGIKKSFFFNLASRLAKKTLLPPYGTKEFSKITVAIRHLKPFQHLAPTTLTSHKSPSAGPIFLFVPNPLPPVSYTHFFNFPLIFIHQTPNSQKPPRGEQFWPKLRPKCWTGGPNLPIWPEKGPQKCPKGNA